jgi:uncharacterized protein YgiB involved in biofilm formation
LGTLDAVYRETVVSFASISRWGKVRGLGGDERSKLASFIDLRTMLIVALASLSQATPGSAEVQRGSYQYYSADRCASAGKVPKEICKNAATNASAEFEEKAPHFSTRTACESAYGPGACAISLRQSGSRGVSFTPRQEGFRLVVRSGNDISAQPIARGLEFSSRTAVRPAMSINPRLAGLAARGRPGAAGVVFGSSAPDGVRGPLPPPVPFDPNFDCAAFVEPSSKGDVQSACAPIPGHR